MSKIRRFWLGRDPLGGIIAELTALSVKVNHTLFDTEGMVIVQLGAVDAVAAAFLDLFAEQHSVSSLSSFSLIIHQPLRYFYSYFCKLRTKMQRLLRSEGRKAGGFPVSPLP